MHIARVALLPALFIAAAAPASASTHRGAALSPGLHAGFRPPHHSQFHSPLQSPFHQPIGHPPLWHHPGVLPPGAVMPAPGVLYPVPVWPAHGTVVTTNGAGGARIERHVRVRQSPGVAIGGGVGSGGSRASVMVTLPQQIDHREVTTIETYPVGVHPGMGPEARPPLSRHAPEGLSDALDSLRAAYLQGDVQSIYDRLVPDREVRVFSDGRHVLSLDREAFIRLVDDRFSRYRTLGFEFDRPRTDPDGTVVVTGTHRVADGRGGTQRALHVAFELQRLGGIWRITAADPGS